ncbi:PRC-barrel domain-containing protein [Mangrovicoccus algicola]|uniref:PRC-barrel domain-containing protein n=1 Tax=Mangrovicoccus algicola TaxID=2771008 RepID=A0A8J6Z607_9RHOB|nr:PRC-barrel domain-containing protein [Mangrovicoccus algicola]MBE3638424.1 PRC-barrel domain-containing protein [Mangrovicoccus algicola]
MTKFTVASTALALVLAAPLSAQTADEMSGFAYNPTGEEVRASQFIGARLYSQEPEDTAAAQDPAAAPMGTGNEDPAAATGTGTEDPAADQVAADAGTPADPRDNYTDVGEIGDVLMNQDGEIEAILVDVGGFLGIGEKEVAVSMDKLQFMPDGENGEDWFVVFESTRQTLENAPAYEDPDEREGMDAADAGTTAVPESENGATGVVPQDQAAAVGEQSGDAAWSEEETAQGDADAMMEQAGDETAEAARSAQTGMEGAAEEAEAALDDAADSMGEAADNAGDAVAGAATGAAATAGQEMQEAGQELEQAATNGDVAQGEAYSEADTATLSAEQLQGARVFDLNDKRIGEVHEAAMSADGKVEGAIVDVGGFLGLGEKRVQLGFDQLNIEKLDGGDELRIQVNATEDELKQMPEYEG